MCSKDLRWIERLAPAATGLRHIAGTAWSTKRYLNIELLKDQQMRGAKSPARGSGVELFAPVRGLLLFALQNLHTRAVNRLSTRSSPPPYIRMMEDIKSPEPQTSKLEKNSGKFIN